MARKTKNLSSRDEFIILTNGKRTEFNYLKVLKSKKSLYNVKIKFSNTDPSGLVEQAIELKTRQNFVWCVFDKDEFPSDGIYDAMKQAKDNGIGVAFSNISFEVWLLYHYKKFSYERTVDQLIDELDKILISKGYSQGYLKADDDAIKKFFIPQINNAITNAKIIHQKRVSEYKYTRHDDNYPYCKWNSYTDVYKLIDALKLQNL